MLSRTLAACALVLAGCATTPITGRQQLALVSEDQVVQASAQAYSQQIAQFRQKGQIDTDPAVVGRVTGITRRIIDQAVKFRPETANWNWQINVIRDPQVNAYAMAGGKIAVYTGLLEKIRPTDDELAEVLAHEVGHALAGHVREKMSVSMGTDLALTAIGIATGTSEQTQQALGAAANLAIGLPNSRGMESEADRIGIELAARAGFNPNAAVSLWQKMGQQEGRPGVPQFLSTHPSDKNRMESLQALVPQMMPYYQSARR